MDDDESTLIRNQMDDTRADLSEKLESLESRVSETVQLTGSAVSDTVTSVRNAVQSVGEALNLPLQVQRHPWIAFGGSVALGYLAARLIESPGNRRAMSVPPCEVPPVQLRTVNEGDHSGNSQFDHRSQQGGVIFGTLLGVMLDLTVRSLPVVLDYVMRHGEERFPPGPTIAPATATLPLSSRLKFDARRPRTRHVM